MTRLGDIAEIIMGQSPTGNTYNQSGLGVPLLNGPTEFGLSHPIPTTWTTEPTKLCDKGDILFCVRGSTTGRMNWADQMYCIGRGLACFRAKTGESDTKFLFFSLMHNLNSILTLTSGSVFPNLSRGDFEKFEIFWPDNSIRKEISDALSSLDDKINLNHRMNQTLEEMARTIFKSWFVDFDPVRAKSEGRDTGLPAEIADLFPDSFEESPLGEIPKGWKIVKIKDLVELLRIPISPNRFPEKSFYHYSIPAFDSKHIPVLETGLSIQSNKYVIEGERVLISKLNPENPRIWFIHAESDVPSVSSTEFLVTKAIPFVPIEYIYSLFTSENFYSQFLSMVA